MSGSALMGEPPNDEHDAQAIKRSWKLNHVNNKPTRKASIIPTIKPHNTPPDSRQTYLNACSIVIIFLTALITGTRLFLRIYQRDLRWGPDDWAILVGALGVVAFFGLTIAMAVLGGRRKHMYDVTYAEFNVFFVLLIVRRNLYYPVRGIIKISITLFNRRLTGFTSRRWMICRNTFLALLAAFIVSSIFANSFLCSLPIVGKNLVITAQREGLPEFINADNVLLAFSSIHSAMGFMLLTVPLIILFRMQMNLSKKVLLGVLFSIGSLSCIGSVMRQVIQKEPHPDLTYNWPNLLKWVIVDMFFAVTVASLPTLNTLFLIPSRHVSNESPQPGSNPSSKLSGGMECVYDRSIADEDHKHQDSSPAKRHTLAVDEEKGFSRKGSQSILHTGVTGQQSEWEGYYPDLRVV